MASKLKDSPLVRAAAAGDPAEVQRLLESGMAPNDRNAISGFAAIHAAAEAGHVGVVRQLVAAGAAVDLLTDPDGPAPQEDFTALMVAARAGHAHVVEALLELGADVNARLGAKHGSTALEQAASFGHAELVVRLLAAGAKPDRAILSGASWRQRPDIVKLLLDAGANPNDVSGMGKPMLVRACSRPVRDVDWPKQREVVQLLLDAGADLEAKDDLGATALIVATTAKNTALALMLLERGANAAARDDGNFTALHAAARDGDMVLAEALLERGADQNVATTFKETPVTLAKENKNKPMLALLNRFAP